MKDHQKHRVFAGLTACFLGAAALAAPLSARAQHPEVPEIRLETVAGVPGNQYLDGTSQTAKFASAQGFDVKNGQVVIADTENNLIRRYAWGSVSTLAGKINGLDPYGNAQGGFLTSRRHLALFDSPVDCLQLDNGKIIVADRDNHAIRMVTGSWVITLNGNGVAGYKEGCAHKTMFSSPSGLAIDAKETIYVADTGNHCIRTIKKTDLTHLFAGTPQEGGFKDGPLTEAKFLEPTAIAVAEDGTMYVADSGNQRIRKIKDGVVTTLSGGSITTYLDTEYLAPGHVDGEKDAARFRFPEGICVAGQVVLVADTGNHCIRAIAPSGYTETIAGTGEAGYLDGAPLEAELNRPSDLAWEDGILYIMDSGNSALRTMPFDPQQWLHSREGL